MENSKLISDVADVADVAADVDVVAEGVDDDADDDAVTENKKSHKIKHIVCSGGGVTGLSFYGALKHTNKRGFWDIQHIQSFYGTSIGSLISVVLALNYDWDTLDDYFIKRPWQNLYKMDMYTLLETFNRKGIFEHRVIQETFSPLFKGKDISLDITMKEFFVLTHIDIHIFTVELNAFVVVDISHKTHPDWKVIDAVYCSCAVPVIFAPFFKDGGCYSDGGILLDYPVDCCIKNGADPDEILGINRQTNNNTQICNKSTMFDYILHLANKTHANMLKKMNNDCKITHEINIPTTPISIDSICSTATSIEQRIRLIDDGIEKSRIFIETLV